MPTLCRRHTMQSHFSGVLFNKSFSNAIMKIAFAKREENFPSNIYFVRVMTAINYSSLAFFPHGLSFSFLPTWCMCMCFICMVDKWKSQ
jgi:hypothetical protein